MNKVIVSSTINADIVKVWECWTNPIHIQEWNHATDDWECPHAVNTLEVGKGFLYQMAAKNGSFSFDFTGTYTEITKYASISYVMDDQREVNTTFEVEEDMVKISTAFDPEKENSIEMQVSGWQSILNNFKSYVEQSKSIS